jgi:hypothetical protein
MSFSLSASAAFLCALGSIALIGCAADADLSADDSANQASEVSTQRGCTSYAAAKAAYDRRVQAEQARVKASYDAALAQFDADVQEAKRVRDAVLSSLPQDPSSNESSDVLNAAITEYNHKVGPDGTIVHAYNAHVATAKDRFDAGVKAALDAYNAAVVCH